MAPSALRIFHPLFVAWIGLCQRVRADGDYSALIQTRRMHKGAATSKGCSVMCSPPGIPYFYLDDAWCIANTEYPWNPPGATLNKYWPDGSTGFYWSFDRSVVESKASDCIRVLQEHKPFGDSYPYGELKYNIHIGGSGSALMARIYGPTCDAPVCKATCPKTKGTSGSASLSTANGSSTDTKGE
eukprot:TRINITY_DN10918_c1_g2_i1.p1 TRINITY_DN10918_c1_g2~~TRINITY_DN10918_c1_g2_i1.p1  ORF type:complete len:201 (-),score=14.26 TRINITY_DN10918_c1_g2_i1:224-778(-)